MSGGCTSSSPSGESAEPPSTRPTIGVVGVCGSGKSTLVAGLRRHGYEARQVGQEHSYVPDLWRRLAPVDVLVFLDASDETVERRLGPLLFRALPGIQRRRLRHAREHAHVYVQTDALTPEQVLGAALAGLRAVPPASAAATPPPPQG